MGSFILYVHKTFRKANKINTSTLREKYPNTELFLVRIQSEYKKIRTRNNSVFGHFSRSGTCVYLEERIVSFPEKLSFVRNK